MTTPQEPTPAPDAFARLQEVLQQSQSRATGRGAKVEELAADVLFLSLLSRTLLQIMLDSRLTTVEYVVARMRQLDMLDGLPDGGLPPSIIAQELGMQKPEVDRKRSFAETIKKKGSGRLKKSR